LHCDRAAECDVIFAKECPDLAEYIFGDHLKDDTVLGHRKGCLGVVSEYSVLISPAWEVVEKLRKEGIEIVLCGQGDRGFSVCLKRYNEWPNAADTLADYQVADTAPLAISQAALKAREVHERPDRG